MNAIIAKLGFSIACLCSAAFLLDFSWLQLRGKPLFGFRRIDSARTLLLWFLLGVTLMMLTFPQIITTYDHCIATLCLAKP